MKLLKTKPAWGWLFVGFTMALYYLVFVRDFFSQRYVPAGDTYAHWSLKYIMLYSLKHFGDLPWWDPTMYNGYPLYYHFLSGWSNYLGPFYLPFLIAFKIISSCIGLTINNALLFHETIYVVLLIVIAIYLISRELITHPVARLLPVFIFCFSYFPLLNFHDFYSHEAMIAPLFYLYALVRFNNRRTPKNLLLLFFFIGLLAASLCNGILMSAFFWTTIFSFLLLICDISLVPRTVVLIRQFLKLTRARIMLFLAASLIISGFIASYLPVYYNAGKVLKYRGGEVDYLAKAKFTNNPIPIETSKIWTVLSNWLPFPEFQYQFLHYGWNGHDHRYIGIITIPLFLLALFYLRNKYAVPLLFTYIICNCFIIYSTTNLAYMIIVDNSDLFRNVRNITSIFSRGGGLLFLILLSGVGFDALLKNSLLRIKQNPRCEAILSRRRNSAAVFLLVFFILVGVGLILYPADLLIYETTFHIGWYLIVFCALCIGLLLSSNNRIITRGIILGIFIAVFLDLTISASHYIDTYARKPWHRNEVITDNTQLRPINQESENMFPSIYEGSYHRTKGVISWGIKEWLAIATNRKWQHVLENYNPWSTNMTVYPSFSFFDKEVYRQLYNVRFISSPAFIKDLPEPNIGGTQLYREDSAVSFFEGKCDILKYTFNEVIVRTRTKQDGFLYFRDNYSEFWTAYLNGQKTKILLADFTFKAIKLPAGTNTVVWVYDPYPIKYAYLVFYAVLTIFIAYYFYSSRFPEMRKLYS